MPGETAKLFQTRTRYRVAKLIEQRFASPTRNRKCVCSPVTGNALTNRQKGKLITPAEWSMHVWFFDNLKANTNDEMVTVKLASRKIQFTGLLLITNSSTIFFLCMQPSYTRNACDEEKINVSVKGDKGFVVENTSS